VEDTQQTGMIREPKSSLTSPFEGLIGRIALRTIGPVRKVYAVYRRQPPLPTVVEEPRPYGRIRVRWEASRDCRMPLAGLGHLAEALVRRRVWR